MFKFSPKTKKEPKNLSEALGRFKKLEENLQNLSKEFEDFKEKSKKDFQKIGLVRFNPFQEIGSDQSFSIAMLDENNNGFIITSHYGREANRVYAKPVNNGQSKYQLSKEEKEAINKAINV